MSVAIAFAFSFFDHFSFYSSQITSHRLQRHVHKLLADNNQTHNPSIVRDSHIISSRVFLPLSFFFSICIFSFFALSPLLCVFVLINNCGLNFSSNFFFSCVRVMLIKRSQKLFKFYARYGILLLLFSSECSMHKQFISGRFSFGSLAYVSILFSFSL